MSENQFLLINGTIIMGIVNQCVSVVLRNYCLQFFSLIMDAEVTVEVIIFEMKIFKTGTANI